MSQQAYLQQDEVLHCRYTRTTDEPSKQKDALNNHTLKRSWRNANWTALKNYSDIINKRKRG